jgi:hypothetical protein
VVDSSTAHGSTAFARLGYDDDGFMCCGKNGSDGGTWQTTLYRSRLGPESARDSHVSTIYPSQDGYLVGKGFSYENHESAYLPIDAEMYWNEGVHEYESGKPAAGPDGHDVAHRMFIQHLTSLSLVHGFSELDGLSSKPRNSLSNESIDVWRRTPLRLDFILAWGMPLAPAFYTTVEARLNATCAAVESAVPPSERLTCDRPQAQPGKGNESYQRSNCERAGCCFQKVSSPGPHPWCFLPRIPTIRKLKVPGYTVCARVCL